MLNPVFDNRLFNSYLMLFCLLLLGTNLSWATINQEDELLYAEQLEAFADSLANNDEKLELSIQKYKEAEEIYMENSLWRDAIDCIGSRAYVESFLGHIDKSLMVNKEGLSLAEKYLEPKDTMVGSLYNRFAEIYLQKGIPDSSIYYFKLAQDIYFDNELWYDYIFTQIGLVNNYFMKGQWNEIERLLNNAELYACEYEPTDPDINNLIPIFKSIFYDRNGDYDKAIEIALQSLSFEFNEKNALSVSDSTLLADRFNNLGTLYNIKGEYSTALDYLRRSLSMRSNRTGEKIKEVVTHSNIADILINKEKFLEALEHLDATYSKLIQLGPIQARTAQYYLNYYNHKAKCFIAQKNYEAASPLILKAIDLNEFEQVDGLISSFRYLGVIEFSRGNYEAAIDAFQKGLAAVTETEKTYILNEVKLKTWIAKSYLELNQIEKAVSTFQETIKLLDKDYDTTNLYANPTNSISTGKLELVQLLEGKAAALKARYEYLSNDKKDLEMALTIYLQIDELVVALFKEYLTQESRQILLQLNKTIYEKAINTALQLYELEKEGKYQTLAFQFAEKSKTILLEERLRDSEEKEHFQVPEAYVNKVDSLKRDLAVYEKNLYLEKQKEKPDSLKSAVWEQKIFALKRGLEKVQEEIRKKYPSFNEDKYANTTHSIKDIQKSLGREKALLLEYFIGDSSIYLFEIGAKVSNVHIIPKPQDFKNRVLQLQTMLSQEPGNTNIKEDFSQFANHAHYFYKLLLAEVLQQNTIRKLIIIPDEVLYFIPFDLLLTEAVTEKTNFGSAAYLLKQYSLNYGFSVRSLIDQRESNASYRGDFRCLAFAPSYDEEGPVAYSGSISRLRGSNAALPEALEEVKVISDYFDGDFYYGPEASEQRFKEQVSQYDLIHLAMHGAADEENPQYSKLFFANTINTVEDDTLYAFEIQDRRLKADLVVLSACETGVGKFVQGEGVMSMASAFLQAGAPSVTMSLWRAQDKSTAMLMEEYYKNLAAGKTKDVALQQAKLAYLSNPVAQKHPFYWATFVNIGDPSALDVNNNYLRFWSFAIFGLVGLIFLSRNLGFFKS